MRLIFLIGLWLGLLIAPVKAATGIHFSGQSLFAPLGKQRLQSVSNQSNFVSGQESSEFFEVGGFYDLHAHWRIFYALGMTLLQEPLWHLSSSLAYVVHTDYPVPLEPFFLLGVDPVFTSQKEFPFWGFNAHVGVGVHYIWNRQVYLHTALKVYLLNTYGSEESRLKSQWVTGSMSLDLGMGYLF